MKIRLHERDWKRGGRAVLFALAAIVALYFFWTTGHLVMAFQEQKRAHIFPTQDTSIGWDQPDNALTQDLSYLAPAGAFTAQNSAFIQLTATTIAPAPEGGTDVTSVPAPLPTSTPPTTDTSSSSTNESSSPSPATSTPPAPLPLPVIEPPATDNSATTSDASSTTDTMDQTQSDATSTDPSVSALQAAALQIANASTSDWTAPSDTAPATDTIIELPGSANASSSSDSSDAGTTTSMIGRVIPIARSAAHNVLSFVLSNIFATAYATSTSVDAATDSSLSSTTSTPDTISTSPATATDTTATDVPDVPNCSVLGTTCHTIQFSGFTVDGSLTNKPFKGVALNLSFAALAADGSQSGRISVRYYHAGSWHSAGDIPVDATISNAANGGYFTEPLTGLNAWSDLSDVKVVVEYEEGDGTNPVSIYLDAVWLDAIYTDQIQDVLSGNVANPNDVPGNVSFSLASNDTPQNSLILDDGTTILFPYLDSLNDTLSIRADKSSYIASGTSTTVYTSITNTGQSTDSFQLFASFPGARGTVSDISQYLQDVPSATTTTTTGDVTYFCPEGWVADATSSAQYDCVSTNETYVCDSVSDAGTNCLVPNVAMSSATSTNYVSAWVSMDLNTTPPADSEVASNLPPGYKPAVATQKSFEILPGQTLYFKVTLATPDSQAMRFVLSARGQTYFGNLNSLRLQTDTYLTAEANMKKATVHDDINEQLSEQSDFGVDQTPTFKFKFKTQRTFFTQVFDFLTGKPDKYTVQNAKLQHESGETEHLPVNIAYGSGNEWTIQLQREGRDFRPGKYALDLSMQEGNNTYSDSVNFYWGVLALNADKSSYEPGDTAHLTIAALDDSGDTMCDAQLALTATDPSGNQSDVPVVSGGGCGTNNVTTLPDFVADYPVSQVGMYTFKLARLDDSGNIVTSITDTIEVESGAPYVITRSGPTRIYPESAYTMQLGVTAANGFTGTVVETVPEGFTIVDAGGATQSHSDGVIYLTWNVSLDTANEQFFSYTFKAPNASPYIYMLGPATMTDASGLEFTEPRTWKIASDAVAIATGVAWLNGTQTTNGANLDTTTAYPLSWNVANSYDTTFYSYSTTTNPSRLTVNVGGDYLVAVTVPIERSDVTGDITSLEADVRVNGVKKNVGVSRAFIKTTSGVNESSDHLYVLLRNLNAGDYIESYVHNLSTATDTISIGTQASMYSEYIGNDQSVYFGLATTTMAGTNLNPAATSTLVWYDDPVLGRSDANYTHSNATSADTVTLGAAGSYFVLINIPLDGAVPSASPKARVLLNGAIVSGGEFKQGYIASASGVQDSSMQWSGVVTAPSANENLTISMLATGAAGTLTTATNVASMYIQSLPASGIYLGNATTTSSGSNWNPVSAGNVLWAADPIIDTSVYSHSTTTNSYQITVSQAGDYLLALNDSHSGTTGSTNQITSVSVGGTAQSGAQTRTHYIPPASATTYTNGYSYMRTITVGANASSTQTNFPMLVSGTYSYLAATSSGGLVNNVNGDDIIFTSDATGSVPLKWEQETYNKTTGAVTYWVNVPSLTNGTVIYMFYGNPSVNTFQGNVAGTWNSNYVMVQHFASTSTVSGTDSTGNAFNGTNSGGTATTGKVGFGGAISFSSQNLMSFSTTSTLTAPFTVETWAQTATAAGINTFFGSRASSDNSFDVKFNNGNLIHGDVGTGNAWLNTAADESYTYSTNTWYHIVYEVSGSTYTIYLNGTSLGTGSITGGTGLLFNSSHTLVIGNVSTAGGEDLNGIMDEARVMNNNPSSSWVLTDYNSQSSPSTFYTVGSQQTALIVTGPQSSGSLVYLLRNLAASSTISVTTVSNGAAATITEDQNALFMLWRKSAQSNFIQDTEWWYAPSNAQTPSDPWPSGSINLNQGDTVTTGNALLSGNAIRLRIGLTANVNTIAGADSFKLQYAPGSICSLALSWSDIGAPGSGSIWRGYNSSGATPGSTLTTLLLSTSSTTETYEDQNPSAVTPYGLTANTDGEWDWSIQDNGAVPGTYYCFRMVESSGQLLKNYTTYPQIITNAAPAAPSLSSPFDDAEVGVTNPALSFLTFDTNGDTVHYEVQVSTDPNFGSTVIDDNSITNYAKFTNTINSSQRAPFGSGQPIQYNPTTSLTNGTTYGGACARSIQMDRIPMAIFRRRRALRSIHRSRFRPGSKRPPGNSARTRSSRSRRPAPTTCVLRERTPPARYIPHRSLSAPLRRRAHGAISRGPTLTRRVRPVPSPILHRNELVGAHTQQRTCR